MQESDAVAGGRSLPGDPGGAGGHGHEHSSSGVPVRTFPAAEARRIAKRRSTIPPTWKLVEPRIKYGAGYGRD